MKKRFIKACDCENRLPESELSHYELENGELWDGEPVVIEYTVKCLECDTPFREEDVE